ncbi:MAG: AAA family ATPase [Methanospirillum sp.]|nr:AAA family ATPase [Methanospirillum sp.]
MKSSCIQYTGTGMNAGKLPIGIQSFKEIRTHGYLYVDKTP